MESGGPPSERGLQKGCLAPAPACRTLHDPRALWSHAVTGCAVVDQLSESGDVSGVLVQDHRHAGRAGRANRVAVPGTRYKLAPDMIEVF